MTETLITRETAILGETIGYPFYTFPNVPTQTLVQQWLRKRKDLHVEIMYMDQVLLFGYNVTEMELNVEFGEYFCTNMGERAQYLGWSYEEALEHGLQYALKLLK